jgi:nucleotide-binding universal stress UspA family protein
MKNLLVLTDFSEAASHAAVYSYALAKQMRANLVLCNVFVVPSQLPQAGLLMWPLQDAELCLNDSQKELKKLKDLLRKADDQDDFRPEVSIRSEKGTLVEVVKEISTKNQIDFIVMASHGVGFEKLMMGNQVRSLINETGAPVLIIPPKSKLTLIRKICLALDFKDLESDLKFVKRSIDLASLLQAKIIITHVCSEAEQGPDFDKSVKQILTDICAENNCANIQYKAIKNTKEKAGLEWMVSVGDFDLLVTVHRHTDFLNGIFKGSLTQKLSVHSTLPLLVFKKELDRQLL